MSNTDPGSDTLDLRAPALWAGVEPARMWERYRAHVNRALDAALPQGRPNAVARVSAPDAPAAAPR